MHKLKKLFFFVVFFLSFLTAFSQTIVRQDNLLYNVWEEDGNQFAEVFGNTIVEPIQVIVPCGINYEGKYYAIKSIGKGAFEASENVLGVTLPQGIVSIKERAFDGCRNLNNIELPIGLTTIGNQAFVGCYNLRSIILPYSVTSVGGDAFEWCGILRAAYPDTLDRPFSSFGAPESRLTVSYPTNDAIIEDGDVFSIDRKTIYYASNTKETYNIPYGIEKIGDAAFGNCDKLINIIAPLTLVEVGNYSFQYCKLLREFKCESNLISIGNFAFTGCENLDYLNLPKTLTYLGLESFSFCSSIESVIIPETIKIIKSGTFRNCSGLRSLTLPNTIEYIEPAAFGGCLKLNEIYYNTHSPIETEKYIFSNETYLNATLFVNKESIDKFYQTSPWLFFAHIEDKDFQSGITVCKQEQEEMLEKIYNINGMKVVCKSIYDLPKGIYIVKRGAHVEKILK